MDLPIVVKFFDHPDKVQRCLPKLAQLAGAGHLVLWPASIAEVPFISTTTTQGTA